MIRTIKIIGQIELRLRDLSIEYYLIPRWQIKRWVFDNFKEVATPRIIKKIGYRNAALAKEGKKPRTQRATFIYVDDWIVIRAMKQQWNIPNATVHNKNKYGLKDHSWQALGLVTFFMQQSEYTDLKPTTPMVLV